MTEPKIICPSPIRRTLDILSSALIYGLVFYYLHMNTGSYVHMALEFIIPAIWILAALGLLFSDMSGHFDPDIRHRTLYIRYLKANIALYVVALIVAAGLGWYFWASIFVAKVLGLYLWLSAYSDQHGVERLLNDISELARGESSDEDQ